MKLYTAQRGQTLNGKLTEWLHIYYEPGLMRNMRNDHERKQHLHQARNQTKPHLIKYCRGDLEIFSVLQSYLLLPPSIL